MLYNDLVTNNSNNLTKRNTRLDSWHAREKQCD